MNLRLHPEWPAILRHAWSVRLAAAAALVAAIEAAVQIHLSGLTLPLVPQILIIAASAGCAFARIVVQRDLHTEVGGDGP